MTEFNHIWGDGGEEAEDYGWVDDERAAEIVRRVPIAAVDAGIAAVALYRWAGDEWALEHNRSVLEVVRERFS